MSHFDRCILSFILLFACLLALREGDYLNRRAALVPDIVISVSGAVIRPGVISLPADGRAVHAIELCGGLSAEADREAIELARPLVDGEHVIVPRRGPNVEATDSPSTEQGPIGPSPNDSEPRSEPQATLSRAAPESPSFTGPGRKGRVRSVKPDDVTSLAEPVDLNKATLAELESLPGVGPVMAGRILQARQASPGGSFGSLEELRAIRGIKGKTLERLKPHLKIEGP